MLMLCMLLFLLRSLHCKRCDGPLCTLTLTCSNPGGGWELPTDDAAKDPGFFAGPRFWASHLKSWALEHVPQCATCLLCSVRVEMNYRQPQHNVSSTMMYSDNDMLHDSWWQECVGPAPLSSEKVLQTSANIESILWLVGTQSNRQSSHQEICIQTFILQFDFSCSCGPRVGILAVWLWTLIHSWLLKAIQAHLRDLGSEALRPLALAMKDGSCAAAEILRQVWRSEAEEPDFNVENKWTWSKINKTKHISLDMLKQNTLAFGTYYSNL